MGCIPLLPLENVWEAPYAKHCTHLKILQGLSTHLGTIVQFTVDPNLCISVHIPSVMSTTLS